MNKNQKLFKGISVIEILVVIAVITIALTGLLGLISFSLGTLTIVKQITQANFISQETMEAARNFRDGTSWNIDGLSTLTTMVFYHPEKTQDSPPKWRMTLGEETIGIFTRKIVFHNVLRDTNNDIVESGGTLDPNTKKVIVFVSWQERGRSHQVQLDTYFTNWRQ